MFEVFRGKRIVWGKNPDLRSFGRNRSGLMAGLFIDLYNGTTQRLILRPINSKGNVAEGCTMEIPAASIPALRAALDEVEASLAAVDGNKDTLEPRVWFKSQGMSHWDNHPSYSWDDWRYEVENNDTRQSYVEWCQSKWELEESGHDA